MFDLLIVCLIVKLYLYLTNIPILHTGGGLFVWLLSQGLCSHIVWYFFT